MMPCAAAANAVAASVLPRSSAINERCASASAAASVAQSAEGRLDGIGQMCIRRVVVGGEPVAHGGSEQCGRSPGAAERNAVERNLRVLQQPSRAAEAEQRAHERSDSADFSIPVPLSGGLLDLVRPALRVQGAAIQGVEPDGEQAERLLLACSLVVEVVQPALCDLGTSGAVDRERDVLHQTFDGFVVACLSRVVDSRLGRVVELAPVRGRRLSSSARCGSRLSSSPRSIWRNRL